MTRLLLLLLVLLVVLPGCPDEAAHDHGAEEAGQKWTCSMHPQVVRDGPGSCPMCGMDLTPMTRGGAAAGDAGTVEIQPGVIQQIGVETQPVARTTVFRHLRTIGELEVGEDELSVVNLRLSGWAERVRVDKTGDPVRAGQTLFDLYSPELVAAQEEYLVALRSQGPDGALTRSARRRLELWDIDPRDIDALQQRGEAARTMPIRAPSSGFVLSKDVLEGARVSAGKDLYRIGNLQRIWVRADVYEHDAPWVEAGQSAQLELPHLGGRSLEGRVDYVYPTLDPKTRTLTVRLEFDNPGVQLKPGMFATVHIQYQRRDDVLAIPSEAVLHSGRRRVVFVSKGRGRFEPREITTGLQGDHRLTEVTSGLSEREVVATSGQFLIDAESQLQEALDRFMQGEAGTATPPDTVWACPMHPTHVSGAPGACPECGMDLVERDGTATELAHVHGPQAAPGQYTCPMHPAVAQDDPGRCPTCGMFLEQVPADAPAPAPDHAFACPDHPSIGGDAEGTCVVCGSAYVPTGAGE